VPLHVPEWVIFFGSDKEDFASSSLDSDSPWPDEGHKIPSRPEAESYSMDKMYINNTNYVTEALAYFPGKREGEFCGSCSHPQKRDSRTCAGLRLSLDFSSPSTALAILVSFPLNVVRTLLCAYSSLRLGQQQPHHLELLVLWSLRVCAERTETEPRPARKELGNPI
jgi:hypothetical protein